MNAIRRMTEMGLELYISLWAGALDHGVDLQYFVDNDDVDPQIQRRVSRICDKQLELDMDRRVTDEWERLTKEDRIITQEHANHGI